MCEQKVKDIRDIGLGDTIRINGKDCLVIASYEYNGEYTICINGPGVRGWILTGVTITNKWDKEPGYKHIYNIQDALGTDCCWYYPNQVNQLECIVKKANCCGNNAGMPAQANVRNERPCPQCGRKNDIGVKECWNCTRPNP